MRRTLFTISFFCLFCGCASLEMQMIKMLPDEWIQCPESEAYHSGLIFRGKSHDWNVVEKGDKISINEIIYTKGMSESFDPTILPGAVKQAMDLNAKNTNQRWLNYPCAGIETGDGWLLGYDGGEFGGALW